MYLPAPPRRGCGRYRKGTHALPSPRSRSPTSAGRAPTGSGAGSAGLRLPPAAAAAPAGSASPAPLVLPPPRPRSSLFSPGSVQAPSSLPARLLSLPRPPGSARFPGEPACSCRAAHIIAAPRTPPAALSRAPRAPGPSRPGSPADHGQIALALSRFTAAPAVGVAAGPAGEDAPRGEGRKPSVRLEPLLPRRDMPPPSAPGWPRWPRCGAGVRGLRPRGAGRVLRDAPEGASLLPHHPAPSQQGARVKALVLGQPSGPTPPGRLRERSTGILTPFGC